MPRPWDKASANVRRLKDAAGITVTDVSESLPPRRRCVVCEGAGRIVDESGWLCECPMCGGVGNRATGLRAIRLG